MLRRYEFLRNYFTLSPVSPTFDCVNATKPFRDQRRKVKRAFTLACVLGIGGSLSGCGMFGDDTADLDLSRVSVDVAATDPGAWLKNEYANGTGEVWEAGPDDDRLCGIADGVAMVHRVRDSKLKIPVVVGYDIASNNEVWRIEGVECERQNTAENLALVVGGLNGNAYVAEVDVATGEKRELLQWKYSVESSPEYSHPVLVGRQGDTTLVKMTHETFGTGLFVLQGGVEPLFVDTQVPNDGYPCTPVEIGFVCSGKLIDVEEGSKPAVSSIPISEGIVGYDGFIQRSGSTGTMYDIRGREQNKAGTVSTPTAPEALGPLAIRDYTLKVRVAAVGAEGNATVFIDSRGDYMTADREPIERFERNPVAMVSADGQTIVQVHGDSLVFTDIVSTRQFETYDVTYADQYTTVNGYLAIPGEAGASEVKIVLPAEE